LTETQTVHEEEPIVDDFPVGQSTQITAPSSEYFPASQLAQLADAVEPVVATNLPAAQLEQLVAPALDWKVPAEQMEQYLEPDDEYLPMEQFEQLSEPAAEYVPAEQL